MSSHNDSNSSIERRFSNLPAMALVSDHLVEYPDVYRTSQTADRAYEKFTARGGEHGHDLEDWLSAERELQVEERQRDETPTQDSPERSRDRIRLR